MAEKIEKSVLASSLVFKQNGKVISGEPEKGTINVYPVTGSALSIISGDAITKALKVQFPKCNFNFFAKPVEIAKKA